MTFAGVNGTKLTMVRFLNGLTGGIEDAADFAEISVNRTWKKRRLVA